MKRKQPAAARKSRAIGGNVLVIALLLVSIAISTAYVREGQDGPLHRVQGIAGMVAAPFQFAGEGIAYAADAAGDAVEDATASSSSYSALKEENAQLKAKLVELEEVRLENERLQDLLGLHERYGIEGVTARIIGTGSDAYSREATVSAGLNAGVELGQAVVGSTGLIGQVVEVSPLTCKVRLLDDPQSGVSAYLQSNRAEGVVKGSVDGMLRLEHVDTSVQVEVGDVVVTSGMGGNYPAGIVVGTVTNVVNAAGTTDRTIVVAPLSAADPMEEVTVVSSVAAPSGDAADDSAEDEA